MDEKIIVLVSDRGDSKHGEISVLDDPQKAERLVETLIEAGFDEERIRVFVGRASEFQISHRPVVALGSGAEAEHRQPAQPASRGGDGGGEAEPQRPPKTAAKTEAKKAAMKAAAPEATPSQGQEEPEDASADEEADPVKFSSLFRSA